MPKNDKYLRLDIGNRSIDVKQTVELPIAISYALEDPENFEQKKSSVAFDIDVPATLENDKSFNTFHNPEVEDLTPGEIYKSPQACTIVAGGIEILKGKGLLKSASKTSTPQGYKLNCYGNNGDWMIDMAESTLWDFVNPDIFSFSIAQIKSSWDFNPNNSALDFVFAPVRYREAFNNNDTVVNAVHLRPAISIYWIIYRAFTFFGYRIASAFMLSTYFKRMMLPWTWGDFLRIKSGTDFLAVRAFQPLSFPNSTAYFGGYHTGSNGSYNHYMQTSDGFHIDYETAPYGYDTSNIYSWNTDEGTYTYTPALFSQFGLIVVGFELHLFFHWAAAHGSSITVNVEWYVNGALVFDDEVFSVYIANLKGGSNGDVIISSFLESPILTGGDIVTYKVRVHGNIGNTIFNSFIGIDFKSFSRDESLRTYFTTTYFKRALGGLFCMKDFEKFKEYKFLDLFRGLIDTFNWAVQTDSINKVVYIEPIYGDAATSGGYFHKFDGVGIRRDWTSKLDQSKLNINELYSEAEKELIFEFKDEGNDGGLNKFRGRYNVDPGSSKYLFPDRFKVGKKTMTNRFFAPVVHVNYDQWKDITGVSPQLIVIVPENISNTSANEAEEFFQPRIAYYKGKMPRATYGGWNFQPDPSDPISYPIEEDNDFPYLFAVNYKNGGENDPVLTYNDQLITTASDGLVGKGLMRRFFLPRLAIMRYGKLMRFWMHLDNNDVANWLHREGLHIDGSLYYLIGIDSYKPLLEESTQCVLWKFTNPTQADLDACYPSNSSVVNAVLTGGVDMKYAKLILLNTDLPK